MLVGTGAFVAAPAITIFAEGALIQRGKRVDTKNAITRIHTRINGIIIGHLSIEEHLFFFRDVVIADKLLTAAEAIKRELGRKPLIAFNVGGAHGGIEDFLVAGHDFTRWVLLQYPKEFWETIIELNGGIENVCSVRSLTLPSNFNAQEAKNNLEDLDENVVDHRLYDIALLNALKQKLAA